MRAALTGATSDLEELLDGSLAPTSARMQAVLGSLRHAQRLAGEIQQVTISETAGGLMRLHVCDMVSRAYDAIEAGVVEKDISISIITCSSASGACDHFVGDWERTGAIVKNLLSAAVRSTPISGSLAIDSSGRPDQLRIEIQGCDSEIGPNLELNSNGVWVEWKCGSSQASAPLDIFVEDRGVHATLEHASDGYVRWRVSLPGSVDDEFEACSHCSHSRWAILGEDA